jgi:hypothetical protein
LEPPLTKAQIRLMLGHSDGDTTDIYNSSELKEIRRKLDMQSTGTTFEEKYACEIAQGADDGGYYKQSQRKVD